MRPETRSHIPAAGLNVAAARSRLRHLEVYRHHDAVMCPVPVRPLDLAAGRKAPVIASVVHIVCGESLHVDPERLLHLGGVIDLPREPSVVTAPELRLHP